jgi:hydrogenase expression/formation protein HypC
MCLAVPVKVVSIKGAEAEVDAGGVKRLVSIVMTPEVKAGQYVLLHTGYAISVIDEAEAQETLKLLQDMLKFDEIR